MRDGDVLRHIEQLGILPVVEIPSPADALPLAEALLAAGLSCAEITFRTPAAAEAIALIHDRLPGLLLGAGTVTTSEQVELASAAGASFLVSPGFDRRIVQLGVGRGLTVIPGVCTPTEVQAAIACDLGVVKFFPAEAMGGIATLKALAGPFPGLRYVPSGGIDPSNLGAYLGLPQVLACGGSWMVKSELLLAGAYDRISELAREAIDLVALARRGRPSLAAPGVE
jgi:2-dehydro-3-deoxyphosphogluconate aldolase / (4S)-4-hydroxy-2-oxoglutarate aldolase